RTSAGRRRPALPCPECGGHHHHESKKIDSQRDENIRVRKNHVRHDASLLIVSLPESPLKSPGDRSRSEGGVQGRGPPRHNGTGPQTYHLAWSASQAV